MIELGGGREFDAIRTLLARWGDTHAAGIGDDAATLGVPRGEQLVVSVDAAVEDRHFRRGWLTSREIGYRAVAAALSDLAAMAAQPLGVLVALSVSDAWRGELAAIADGIGEAVAMAGTRVVGGNTSAASELSITTTVLGSAYSVLRRDGLSVGDALYVTGAFGGPGAALHALRAGTAVDAAHRNRFAHPLPRLHEARWLADRGATAAIDVSDGLVADLGHLAAASAVRIEIDLDVLPVVDGVSPVEAAASGEEYELIVGSRSAGFECRSFAARFGIPLTRIGRVSGGASEVVLTQRHRRVANPGGYDHLST